MLLTSKLAEIFPVSQQARAKAWLATHDIKVPYAGLILGGAGVAIGNPTAALSLFATGVMVSHLINRLETAAPTSWNLPHTRLKESCLEVEASMRKAGIYAPELLRLNALKRWSLAWASTLRPSDAFPIDEYRVGHTMVSILTPESIDRVLAKHPDLSLEEHMAGAYWLEQERALVNRTDYSPGVADFVIPYLKHNRAALAQELLQNDLDRFDNALFDPKRQMSYQMRLRKGLLQQSESCTTSWYSDILHDLRDRYPMFSPVVQTWFNVYGEEAWFDPLDALQLVLASENSKPPEVFEIPDSYAIGWMKNSRIHSSDCPG